MNEYQRFVLDTYEKGEFSYIDTEEELSECGDGLLIFLAHDQEDTESFEEAVDKLNRARHQVVGTYLKAWSYRHLEKQT